VSPSAADAAVFGAVNAVVTGLGLAALFTNGWWALLVGWAGLRTGALPRPLAALGLLWGAAGIAALAMPPLALLALVLGLPVTVWLGVVLLSG
jgi:hypothetical protein